MFFAVSWYACHPKIHNPCQGAQCFQRRIVGNDVAVPLRQKALQRMVPTVAAMRRWKLEVGGEDVWFPGSQRKVHRGMGINKQRGHVGYVSSYTNLDSKIYHDVQVYHGISTSSLAQTPKVGMSANCEDLFFQASRTPQETQWENQSWSQPEETNR